MTALHEPTTTRTDSAPDDRGSGMFRSLRVRNYRLYASGQLVSLTGTWMQRVAQDWLVLQLTNSGTALGVVTALQFGPSLFLGLWGGVLADRWSGARVTALTFVAMAVGAGLVLLASAQESLPLFVGAFTVLFVLSGIGNGSTYKMIPAVFRARSRRLTDAGADPVVADRYRDRILVPGGSKDAADLVEDFLGRPYTFDAYAAWLAE